jgi:hypothetical protein
MIVEAFARNQFLLVGRESKAYGESRWSKTEHDLDLIVERDGVGYGIEVKNTLSYMNEQELRVKLGLCEHIGVRPIFVVRMLPRTWANDIIVAGGYAMILGWQLYPRAQAELAKTIREELGLPVDSPTAVAQGTMEKLLAWHRRNV